MDCNEQTIVTKIFGVLCSPSSLYLNMSTALTLDQNLSYLGNLSSSSLHIPHNSFIHKKISPVKCPGKCVDTSRTWSVQRII